MISHLFSYWVLFCSICICESNVVAIQFTRLIITPVTLTTSTTKPFHINKRKASRTLKILPNTLAQYQNFLNYKIIKFLAHLYCHVKQKSVQLFKYKSIFKITYWTLYFIWIPQSIFYICTMFQRHIWMNSDKQVGSARFNNYLLMGEWAWLLFFSALWASPSRSFKIVWRQNFDISQNLR